MDRYGAFVMHHWPSVTPWNVYTLEAHWWAYLVRAAEQLTKPREA